MRSTEKACRATLAELGRLVLDAREASGLTQHDVEDRLGLAGGYMSQLEGAKRNVIPTIENATAVARVVKLDVAEVRTLVLTARLFRALAKASGKFSEREAATAAAAVASRLGR